MPDHTKSVERGPIYGVELLDSLPLGKGIMRQQLPNRRDLEAVCRVSQRTAAGYEVLLRHYSVLVMLLKRVDGMPCEVQAACGSGEPHFLFAVPCDLYAELQAMINVGE